MIGYQIIPAGSGFWIANLTTDPVIVERALWTAFNRFRFKSETNYALVFANSRFWVGELNSAPPHVCLTFKFSKSNWRSFFTGFGLSLAIKQFCSSPFNLFSHSELYIRRYLS